MKLANSTIAILLLALTIEVGLIADDFSQQHRQVDLASVSSLALTPAQPPVKEVEEVEVLPPPPPTPIIPIADTEIAEVVEIEEAKPSSPKPRGSGPLALSAQAWLAVFIPPAGDPQVLASHNASQSLAIASLTKLITAIVSNKEIDSGVALSLDGDLKTLGGDQGSAPTNIPGAQMVRAGDLVYPLLVESNNNAASALASVMPEGEFVVQMNLMAQDLGLLNTGFYNPHGLDSEGAVPPNYSTAENLVRLAEIIVSDYPELLAVTKNKAYSIQAIDGTTVRQFKNTNKLIDATDWPATVLGGKTGHTDLAKRNLLLILRDQGSGGLLITVVLGADDHFATTTDFLDWIYYHHDFS
ncbi:MAG: serine hydrolase [Patescibacteria group bacterium]|nr:serine hydrolase [Patescibacteria group bacterium]